MSGLDLVLGGILGVGFWRGWRTGALSQIVSTVGWVLAFVSATALMGPVGELVAASLGVSARTAPVLGFIVVFGAVIAALTVGSHIGRKTLEAIKLGSLDTAAGGAVGSLRAAFGLSVMLLATGFAPIPGGGPILVSETERSESVLYDPVEALAPQVWDVVRAMTPGLQQAIADKFNTWQEGRAEPAGEEAP
ncbi:MAG: CvpA family protein [Bacteroidota bacterium]